MLLNLFQSLMRWVIASITGLFLLSSYALAQVEVNSADQAALESVRGLGPSKAKAILEERKKNGPYKDANDLHTRVKGIGEKTVERMMQNGLTINRKASSGAEGKPERTKEKTLKEVSTKSKEKENSVTDKAPKQSRKTKEEKKTP